MRSCAEIQGSRHSGRTTATIKQALYLAENGVSVQIIAENSQSKQDILNKISKECSGTKPSLVQVSSSNERDPGQGNPFSVILLDHFVLERKIERLKDLVASLEKTLREKVCEQEKTL